MGMEIINNNNSMVWVTQKVLDEKSISFCMFDPKLINDIYSGWIFFAGGEDESVNTLEFYCPVHLNCVVEFNPYVMDLVINNMHNRFQTYCIKDNGDFEEVFNWQYLED